MRAVHSSGALLVSMSGGSFACSTMTIAIATTVLYPTTSFITWLDYHLQRVELVLIYMDDITQRPIFEVLCGDRPVLLFEGASDAPSMSPSSRTILRQSNNLKHAIAHLLAHGTTWLLHIDIDEILWENGDTNWSLQPNTGCVTFTNHEAVPPRLGTDRPFHDCVWFKVNGCKPGTQLPFMAYGNGKSAVRLRPGVAPDGPHSFQGYNGKHITMPGEGGPVLLHYPCVSFEAWAAKFKQYGDFSDFWFDDPDKPNYIQFMLLSRDHVKKALESGDWKPARAFYESMTIDDEACQRAVSSGQIRRYAPFEKDSRYDTKREATISSDIEPMITVSHLCS